MIVAGLRVPLTPGVSVPDNVPIGANVTVTVGELNGVTVATGVRELGRAARLVNGAQPSDPARSRAAANHRGPGLQRG